jgi:hypothetical protein
MDSAQQSEKQPEQWINLMIRLPRELAAALDQAVRASDLDKSKFVRHALREKISRMAPASVPQTPTLAASTLESP